MHGAAAARKFQVETGILDEKQDGRRFFRDLLVP